MTDTKKRFLRFAIITFLICIFLEIFLFNINSFHLFGGKYSKYTFDMGEDVIVSKGEKITLEWTDINMPVGTLTFDVFSDSSSSVNVKIDMADDTNATYRYDIASGKIISGNKRSNTIVCNFSGNVHKLRVKIDVGANETVTLKSVTANIPVPFHFSIVRFLIFWTGSLIIYVLLYSPFMKKEYGDNARNVNIVAYAVTGVLLIFAIILTSLSSESSSITKSFLSTTGNQMTKELVDAFSNGSVSLLQKPSKEILALDNPYDWSARYSDSSISYLWDHLLYDGKYYSYYGIAPVVLLFLPYHLITGYYFPSAIAVLLFGAIGIVFLTKIYLWVIRNFYSRLHNNIVMMGLIMIQLVTGVWFCFNVPNFYEIAQTSGFAAVTCGAYFLLSSGVISEEKISRRRLAVGTTFLALAVLCRPTLAVYCVVSLILIVVGAKKVCENGKKNLVSYLLCALLPYVIIGSVQMAYNYVRFGSVLDFGIQYSLTINDFTKAQYHTHFVWISIYNYLFKWPGVSANFPFFGKAAVELFNANGYYFVATNTAIGLLWKALPVVSYVYGIKVYRESDNPKKKIYLWVILAACIIAPLIIIASIWESGYGARYSVDFAWQMLLGALIIAFFLYNKCNTQTQKILTRLMLIATIICFILTFGQIYQWLGDVTSMTMGEHANYLSFGRLFEFWK